MNMFKNGEVKRLHSACCGMENGRIYKAKIGASYVSVLLPDETWTCDHWAGFGHDRPFFEVLKQESEWQHTEPKE